MAFPCETIHLLYDNGSVVGSAAVLLSHKHAWLQQTQGSLQQHRGCTFDNVATNELDGRRALKFIVSQGCDFFLFIFFSWKFTNPVLSLFSLTAWVTELTLPEEAAGERLYYDDDDYDIDGPLLLLLSWSLRLSTYSQFCPLLLSHAFAWGWKATETSKFRFSRTNLVLAM